MTDLVALRKELVELAARLHVAEREITDNACRMAKSRVDIVYGGRAAMAVDALIHAINTARIQIRIAYEEENHPDDL